MENVVIMKLVVSQKTVGAKSVVQKEAQGCWPYQKIESSQEELLSLQNPLFSLSDNIFLSPVFATNEILPEDCSLFRDKNIDSK